MTSKLTPQERLERLIEDFHEWSAFPCNAKGNRKDADEERAGFVRAINEAYAAVEDDERRATRKKGGTT